MANSTKIKFAEWTNPFTSSMMVLSPPATDLMILLASLCGYSLDSLSIICLTSICWEITHNCCSSNSNTIISTMKNNYYLIRVFWFVRVQSVYYWNIKLKLSETRITKRNTDFGVKSRLLLWAAAVCWVVLWNWRTERRIHHQQVLQPLVFVISGATLQVRHTLTSATMKIQSQVVTIKSTAAPTKSTKNQ